MPAPAAAPNLAQMVGPTTDEDRPWKVVLWNDPVNTTSLVVLALQQLFGFDRLQAEHIMWEAHHNGRAVVRSGPRERAEADVAGLHAWGLSASVERDA